MDILPNPAIYCFEGVCVYGIGGPGVRVALDSLFYGVERL